MSKKTKKRTKKYSGTDAAVTRPTIVRVSAVDRSRLGQWWFDHKRVARPVLIAAIIVAVILFCIFGLLQIIF